MKKFLKRVLNNLIRANQIPYKLYHKINYHFKLKNYNQSLFEKNKITFSLTVDLIERRELKN